MKKLFLAIFAMMALLLVSCSNDDITITTKPKVRTLTYVVNTQSMYDELGITSETVSNYLNKNYNVGVYTFIYDSEGNLVTTQSSKASSFGTITEAFQFEEGTYTIVTYETLIGNGYTPSWSGQDKLTTLTFDDNSSSDYHYTLGTVKAEVPLIGGDKTKTVSPAATKVLLSYNINTQSVYDEFGVATKITNNYLRDKTAAVRLFTYIYNTAGDLVDSVATQQFTLNGASQIRSLAKGNYTIVTIETLVDPDNSNRSDSWTILEPKKLSTLKLSQIYPIMGYSNIVGVCTTTANVNSNITLTAIPKAIGAMVRFLCYNFAESPYLNVGFGTFDVLNYYSIDPQLSREDRFVEDLSQSGQFTLRGSLSTERISEGYYSFIYVAESHITPFYAFQKEQQVGTTSWSGIETEEESLEDGKIYYAGFYYLFDSNFSHYFGNATGLESWKAYWDEYINTLTPPDDKTLFAEPYLTWGGTVNAVKSFMSGYREGNNGNLVTSGDSYVLWYYGKYKESEIDYYFTSATGGLTDAVLFFDSEKVGEDDLSKAFDEMGYTFLLSEDNYSGYITKDNSSFVVVQLNSQNYWVVHYFSASSDSESRRNMIKKLPTYAPKRQSIKSAKHFDKANIGETLRQSEKMMKLYFK